MLRTLCFWGFVGIALLGRFALPTQGSNAANCRLSMSDMQAVIGGDVTQYCTGCAVKSIFGDCGPGEDFWDPCEFLAGCVNAPGTNNCPGLSIDYHGLEPKEFDERNIPEDDNRIPVKESRVCRIEYKCEKGNAQNGKNCSMGNCDAKFANAISSCAECTRGAYKDTVSMPAHWCMPCPN